MLRLQEIRDSILDDLQQHKMSPKLENFVNQMRTTDDLGPNTDFENSKHHISCRLLANWQKTKQYDELYEHLLLVSSCPKKRPVIASSCFHEWCLRRLQRIPTNYHADWAYLRETETCAKLCASGLRTAQCIAWNLKIDGYADRPSLAKVAHAFCNCQQNVKRGHLELCSARYFERTYFGLWP